jgi:hypothetical protein
MKFADKIIACTQSPGSPLGFGLFRVVVGLMVIRHFFRFIRSELERGYFGDAFYLPYFEWLQAPPWQVYVAVIALALFSASALVAGLWVRPMALLCFSSTTYHFLLNEIWYRHNRYFLVISLFFICLAPTRAAFARNLRSSQNRPANSKWVEFLLKAQMTLIYWASAWSKALDPAWSQGEVLARRKLGEHAASVVPDFIADTVQFAFSDHFVVSTGAIAIELALGVLLWVPATRRLAIWIGVLFHGFIEVSASVATFSYLTMATYFVFADLKPMQKMWVVPTGNGQSKVVAWVLAALDWLMQVQVVSAEVPAPRFFDGRGRSYTGAAARIMLFSNLPLLFPLFYPASLFVLARRRFGRDSLRETKPVASPAISWIWPFVVVHGLIAYLFFINFPGPARVTFEDSRFLEMPWYVAILSLVALVFRRQTLRARAVE